MGMPGKRGDENGGRRGWEDRSFSFREGRKGKRVGLRSHREVVEEAEGMSSSGERGSPCGGCVEKGYRKGGRGQREKRVFLWGMPRERGDEDGGEGVGRTGVFLFGKDARGKREGLRSHREVARKAEVRAVAAKEDPPCGGCVEEGCGKGGRGQQEKRVLLWECQGKEGTRMGGEGVGRTGVFLFGKDARGKGWACGRIGKLWGRRRYEQ